MARATPVSGRGEIDWLFIGQVLLLVLLPCLCYLPALNGTFLWDDDMLITNSPMVQSANGLRLIWLSTVPFDYFPLTNTSFWAEWMLWGNDPLGYHVVNLALHLASAFLFWRLLGILRVPGAWFGALLFAIHPINVASVGWIAERKNVLSMVFYFGSLICYFRSEDEAEPRAAAKRYAAALALFVLAVLSKSSVVMLPCVLLLLAWWRRGRVNWRDAARSLPFFAVSLAGGLLTMWFQYHRTMTHESYLHANALPVRVMFAGRAVFFYLGKILWPTRLGMLYPHWTAGGAWNGLWPFAVVALLAAAWWGRKLWGRGPLMALGYFVLTLLPVSGLLHMSFFKYSNVSDHLVYVSAPGIMALAAALLGTWYLRGGTRARAALVTMTAIIGLGCLGCFQRAGEFSSSESLWRSTLEINPGSADAHNNLGIAFTTDGNLLLAEGHFRAALRMEPRMDSAGTNLANVFRMESRWVESAALYRRVLDQTPDPRSYNNFGVVLLEMHEYDKAREALQNALRLDPAMGTATFNLYRLALAEHDVAAAGAQLRACLRMNPDDAQALMALVALNVEQPNPPPLPPQAAEAVLALAEEACQRTGYANPQALGMLSKAFLGANRRPEAITLAQRAQSVALQNKQTELAAGLGQYLRTLQP